MNVKDREVLLFLQQIPFSVFIKIINLVTPKKGEILTKKIELQKMNSP